MNHPNFDSEEVAKHKKRLSLVNDFYLGFDTSVEHIEKYNQENTTNYGIRQRLSRLTNYTREAVDTIRDMIFRRSLDLSELEGTFLEPFLNTINLKDTLEEFMKELCINVSRDGYAYILVDKPSYENVETKADSDKLRPYFVNIPRSIVRNYKMKSDGTYRMLTYDEIYTIDDGYAESTAVQQRVYLDDGSIEIWREDELYRVIDTALYQVPIVKVGEKEISEFYDLSVINRSHLNMKSEQRSYGRMGCAPIPVTYLANAEDSKVITFGINDGLNFNSSRREAGFEWVELEGKNNEVIGELIKDDETDMREFIATLIKSDVQRTAKEANLMNAGNESTLNHYATQIEKGINKAFKIMAIYQGVNSFDKGVKVNRDFIDTKLSPEEIQKYMDMFTQGIISYEKLIYLFIQGETLPPMTDEEIATEKERLILE